MFQLLGKTVSRAWAFILLGWVVAFFAAWHAAAPWNTVVQDKEFAFLPADAPSRRSEAIFRQAFPDDKLASNVVLVLHRADREPTHIERDKKFIAEVLEPGLRKIAEAEGGLASEAPPTDAPLFGDANDPTPAPKPQQRSIIARIRTPNAPGTGVLLVSADQQAMLIVVELTTEFLAKNNWPTISKIEYFVKDLREQAKIPPGDDLSITGSAVMGRDHSLANARSVRSTESLTVLLVVVLLILIYRAPLLALIPLATVYLAVQLSLKILTLLAEAGYLTLFQGIQIYITILAYGAGVDYCLFLTARYKEELDSGKSPSEAVAAALGGVGAALSASAITVICGIGMMVFAEFGKFREAGIAIPLCLFLVLIGTLTFSPALLRLAGRWAFWPQHQGAPVLDQQRPTTPAPGLWHWLLQPGKLQRGWEWMGQLLVRKPGAIWLTTVGCMAPFAVVAGLNYNYLSYDMIGNLPADAPSVVGTHVLQEHFPAGLMGPVDVLLVSPQVDFGSKQGRDLVEELTKQLRDRRKDLGLADLRTLTAPLGISEAAEHAPVGFEVSEQTRQEALDRAAREHYVTDLGERAKIGTRLDLILEQGPFSHWSVEDLDRVEHVIRDALPAHVQQNVQLYFYGPTASIRDLQAVMQRDRSRIELLVLASVFVVLILLLRRLVVPIYLLLSVLFSYYATLGVAFTVFWLLDPHGFTGIDWKVAIFLFTILIAVGEDYNIFLMARIDEEERQHGVIRGITEALTRTGPIISSCGIIMAGTFASLLAGSLAEMKQLGFALAFGILLDTFVVRPILVPAFLVLLQSGRLHPAHWLGRGSTNEAATNQFAPPMSSSQPLQR